MATTRHVTKKTVTKKTVDELARWLGGEPEGDLARPLTGAAALESAGVADVAFLDSHQHSNRDSERNVRQAQASQAGCLLAPPGVSLPGRTVIRVKNPRSAMARAVELFHPALARQPGIHPTAVIGKSVTLGDDVAIGPCAVIGDGAEIGSRVSIGAGCVVGEESVLGEDCTLYPRVTLYPGVRLGSRVILHSGSVLGSDGFGYMFENGRYSKFPQAGTVEIADDVEVGANTTIDRGALGPTRIGRGTKIDNLVQIAHNVQIGANCVIASGTGISGSVVIEDYVVIAGQVGIGDHARVGKGAVLGGQCGILPHKVVRPGETVWGTPARPLKEYLRQQALAHRAERGRAKKNKMPPQKEKE
jgi:UDP-3-O-[3-hydroxymyristoyl] glucosamine N-acyltransferase